MPTISEIQDEIIEECSAFEDWFEKYEYLIQLGQSLEPFDSKLKTDENSISGCQSQVWLTLEVTNNKVTIRADSDAMITRGIVALLLRVLNNQTPGDVANSELYFIDRIGLGTNLSPSRSNGLVSIIKRIKSCAATT